MKYKETPDITLKMMIDSGFIKPTTKVYASINHNIVGTINSDGSISVNIDNMDKIFPYPSGAARAFVKTSINGWLFWEILELGEYKSLAILKKEYKNKQ